MNVRYANESDYDFIKATDTHFPQKLMHRKVAEKEVILLLNDRNERVGWLRYGYFWDNIPFMNMLFIEEAYRCSGFGRELVVFWEKEMKKGGFNFVMTSTQSDEQAQHFYRKLGYKDAGGFILEEAVLEIIFTKKLS